MILRCHPTTVARLRGAGKLPFIAGRPAKIRLVDFHRWSTKNHLGPREGVRDGKVISAEERIAAQRRNLVRGFQMRSRTRAIVKALKG